MAVGNAIAMSVSLAGSAAILASSAIAFAVLKWLGAAYLIIIGCLAIIRTGQPVDDKDITRTISARTAFMTNVAVGTFHPKTILFFVAFASQFIRPDEPYLGQAMILVATFTGVAATTDTIYAFAASRASALVRSPKARLWSQRAGGGAIILAGVATAAMRR
jgi:threonine/homoserine/homoserine lactone efflux protein